jgi:hypothetical protein
MGEANWFAQTSDKIRKRSATKNDSERQEFPRDVRAQRTIRAERAVYMFQLLFQILFQPN